MAIDQKTMLQAIYDAMYDSLTTAPAGVGGGKPILPRTTSYMSLLIPGNPVDPSQFANAWSPQNPTGSMAAAENFATLVDPIPHVSPVYSPGASTDEMYGEIVNANVSPSPPDPQGQAAFDKAERILFVDGTDFDEEGNAVKVRVPSPFFRNYQNKMKLYSDVLTSYLSSYLQYDLSNPQDQRKWAILGPVLQGPVDLAWDQLQAARPGVIETALATMGQYQQSSRASVFAKARQAYEATRRSSLADPGLFWHHVEAFPANWFAESAAASFTTVTIDSTKVRISEDSRMSSYGGGGGINLGLWRVGGSASHTTTQYDMSTDTSSMLLSFSFARVELRDPWNQAQRLASMNGWSVAGRGPGAYSDGTVTTNEGVFPLVRRAIIVARDLSIKADWGQTDLSILTKATQAGASVGWGPFSLSGNYSNSSSARKFTSEVHGDTLTLKTPNIIAVQSEILHASGPSDGPPTLAQPQGAPAARRRSRGAHYNPYAEPYASREEQPLELEDAAYFQDNGAAMETEATVDDGSAAEEEAAVSEALAATGSNGHPGEPSQFASDLTDGAPESVFVSAEG